MTGERPVLFSKPMVLALLEGRKTQTRRVAKPRRATSLLARYPDGSMTWADSYILDAGNREALLEEAPAKVGEIMYVREAFRFGRGYDETKPSDVPAALSTVFYEADAEAADGWSGLKVGKLRPGIHMPAWCSRIEREVVGIRLERLNDCSEADAVAEGVYPAATYAGKVETWLPTEEIRDVFYPTALEAYRALWEHINGPGSWAENPLVWVIEFSPS